MPVVVSEKRRRLEMSIADPKIEVGPVQPASSGGVEIHESNGVIIVCVERRQRSGAVHWCCRRECVGDAYQIEPRACRKRYCRNRPENKDHVK